eukprot:1175965-Prorocentrum_minimum.AAC.2
MVLESSGSDLRFLSAGYPSDASAPFKSIRLTPSSHFVSEPDTRKIAYPAEQRGCLEGESENRGMALCVRPPSFKLGPGLGKTLLEEFMKARVLDVIAVTFLYRSFIRLVAFKSVFGTRVGPCLLLLIVSRGAPCVVGCTRWQALGDSG